jgi:hypothetical protein
MQGDPVINVSATISRIAKIAPDAPSHEHRDASVRLIVAYDGNEESISRVLSVLERVANRRA